jgi:purine-nucleoside phosphorylase
VSEAAEVAEAVRVVRARLGARRPTAAIVLGSGLGSLAEQLADAVRIPYGEIRGFPLPTVQGHAGELIGGTLGGHAVVAQSGRFHAYEGHGADVAARAIRLYAALGIGIVILTNAAGGIRRSLGPGTLMLIADHLNLAFVNPLTGPVLAGEGRFPDMSHPYDPALRALAREVARVEGIRLEEGVYAGLLGPSYETPAEIRMLERLGADAVGMSTVLEVIAARAAGLRCLAISTITNPAAGTSLEVLDHADVMRVANRVRATLGALVEGIVAGLP